MAKGVKKIKCIEGLVSNGSATGVAIAPDKYAWFKVDEWESGTTDKDKQKEITWIRQSSDRSTIIHQKLVGASQQYGFMLPKKLCGPYAYYIEASLSGQRDFKQATGMLVRGYCPPLIKASKWCSSNDGADVRKSKKFSYGEAVYLNLDTEGLNGSKGLIVEVYNKCAFSDKKIFTYTNIYVIDGEVNLAITNTAAWQGQISNIKDEEEFYIQIKDPSGAYIKDANDDIIHARFLRIKNELVSSQIKTPTNLTPLKVGKQELNEERYEPCKFDGITITETQKKDGKMEQTKVVVFEKGKKLIMGKPIVEIIHKTVFFEFDQATLTPQSIEILKSTLNFLLGHEHSEVTLNGYACVIGPEDYNFGLSIRRSENVKKYFTDGGLAANRIISYAKGEIQMQDGKITGGATDDKKGKDNKQYKSEKDYEEARRVDIMFYFYGHSAQTIVYETVAPSKDKNLVLDVSGLETNKCFRTQDKHKKKIIVTSAEYPEKEGRSKDGDSMQVPVHSALSVWNAAPLQYIWPKWNLVNGASGKGIDSANQYLVNVHSCRYFTDSKTATVLIKAYPDIKWTLEFKWNHKQAFAYSYGKKMHPYDIKTGREKVIGAAIDAETSRQFGEMEQSFELSLGAEWNEKGRTLEIGHEFAPKIAKTLWLFNKIKQAADKITNSPVNNGKASFEVKAPVIAVSVQWSLERVSEATNSVATVIELGIESKPLLQAVFQIDLWKIFREYGPNAICPGAGKIVAFVLEHIEGNVGIHFIVAFDGSINVKGQIKGNTLLPKDTRGKIETTGKIQVGVEFKAWAKGDVGLAGFDGYIKANVDTSVTGGFTGEIGKDGVLGYPVLEFGGIIAKYVTVATVKFGFFKKTFQNSGEYIIVEKNEGKFEKMYLLGPYK